jgi:8-oxo-dGTP diphosphatase
MERLPGPLLTVDCVVARVLADGNVGVLLVERRFPPHGWALPGGFVDVGESCESAALRELAEETALAGTLLWQQHTYSDPARDARRHTASVVFVVRADGDPQAGDDAGKAEFWPLSALPPLCFDHGQIVQDFASAKYAPASAVASGPLGAYGL